jgi:hypothetical protein
MEKMLRQSEGRVSDRKIIREMLKKDVSLCNLSWALMYHLDVDYIIDWFIRQLAQSDQQWRPLTWILGRRLKIPSHLLVQQLRKDILSQHLQTVSAAIRTSRVLMYDSEDLQQVIIPIIMQASSNQLPMFQVLRCVQYNQLDQFARKCLTSEDPSLMFASLLCIRDPKFIDALCHIAKQILDGKLGSGYQFHEFQAPFIIIRLLKTISASSPSAPGVAEFVKRVISKCAGDSSFGVLLECARICGALRDNSDLLLMFQPLIAQNLESSNANLKYFALELIRLLDKQLISIYKLQIVQCLSTRGISYFAMSLLLDIANDTNAKEILDLIIHHYTGGMVMNTRFRHQMLATLTLLPHQQMIETSLTILVSPARFGHVFREQVALSLLAVATAHDTALLEQHTDEEPLIKSIYEYHLRHIAASSTPINVMTKELDQDRVDALRKQLKQKAKNDHARLKTDEYDSPKPVTPVMGSPVQSDETTQLLPDTVIPTSGPSLPQRRRDTRQKWTVEGYVGE